ncbi:uncharacterized protein LOC144168653 [Haemaphysalis longicornis]
MGGLVNILPSAASQCPLGDPSCNEPWCRGVGLLLLLLLVLDICLFCACLWRFRKLNKRVAAFADGARRQATTLTDRKYFSRVTWFLVWTSVLLFLALDSKMHRPRIVATAGMVLLVGFGYIFSNNRTKIC